MARDTLITHAHSDWRKAGDAGDTLLRYLAGDSTRLGRALRDPIMLDLLSPQGRTILDLGCGEGYLSRTLTAAGAARVVGVDISAELLEHARERDPSGEYHLCDITTGALFAPRTFDAVASSMMLMYVNDLDAMFAAVAAALVPGGKLVVSMTHPCYAWPVGRWTADGELLWITQYFGERSADKNLGGKGPVPHFHRPLSNYINAAHRHGLALQAMIEPQITTPLFAQFAKSQLAQQLTRVPLFVMLAFRLQEAGSGLPNVDAGQVLDPSLVCRAPSPEDTQAELSERCNALAAELAAMRSSKSWRLTAPLRRIASTLRG